MSSGSDANVDTVATAVVPVLGLDDGQRKKWLWAVGGVAAAAVAYIVYNIFNEPKSKRIRRQRTGSFQKHLKHPHYEFTEKLEEISALDHDQLEGIYSYLKTHSDKRSISRAEFTEVMNRCGIDATNIIES